jgi:hypothetical protein
MKEKYTLHPSGFEYVVEEHFPRLNDGERIGIFISGGMESTLVSLIAIELYGRERIEFVFSDNIFSSNDAVRNRHIYTNIRRVSDILKITPTLLKFDYELHVSDRKKSIANVVELMRREYKLVNCLWGFTKLFFDAEPFKQHGQTADDVRALAYSDPEKYRDIIEEFHLPTNFYTQTLLDVDVPAEVFDALRSTNGFFRSPVKDLNKSSVVDFYRQLGWLDKLYATSSCIRETITETGKHCGNCFNCQQRWDAFQIHGGVPDETPYLYDTIKHRRNELVKIYNPNSAHG